MTTRPTSGERASSAQICRDRGWRAGDCLAALGPIETVRITAVGRREVLAELLTPEGAFDAEFLLDLRVRDWTLLAPATPDPPPVPWGSPK